MYVCVLGLLRLLPTLKTVKENSSFSNSCRNPDLDEFGPWCYIEGGRSRDYCDIPMCPGRYTASVSYIHCMPYVRSIYFYFTLIRRSRQLRTRPFYILFIGFPDCSPEYEFRCDDGRCVPREKECDGTTDCQDGSDEVRPCGMV